MSIHERLSHARKRSSLSQAQVKERTGIGESSLSDFENGKREPSLSQLQKLAELYQRSIGFFLEEGPVKDELTVLWRMRPERHAEEIEARFLRLCEQYHNIEVWCNERAPVCLPPATGDAARFGCPQAEELAKRVRKELELGDRPGLSLAATLEEVCGVKVFYLDFEPSGTAASVVSDSFGAAVLLNSKNVRWRRNHDLAHELFHLLTWPIFHSSAEAIAVVAADTEEKLATCFARHLLMPSDPFRSAINARMHDGRMSFEFLFDVAREFDVSVESVLWHMHFLYGRGPGDAERTKQEIERAKTLAPLLEEREDRKPHPWPARYHALAVKALRRGEMSIGRFAEYLNIKRQDAMRYVEQEVPGGEEVQVTPA